MDDWTPEQLQKNLDDGKDVFLKLWKKGCGACKLSKPALQRIEEKKSFPLVFGQINTVTHPEMLEVADTEVLPVFFVFKNQKMTGKFLGFKGLAKLEEFISDSMAK